MKILNCYIKGFGTYYNKEFTFHDGLNYLYELNGEGKTTLASFIKAMLYGLESYKDNSKDFKDRKHYKPFNNNSFGGSLTFISNNKTYKVERTFDAKSQEKDTIAIYVNDVLENFDKEIGEEILQLDKDAFERLMYITSSDIKIESNSNLKKHLNNIIDATDESFNYDDIFKNVNQHKNKYDRNKNSLIQDEKNNSSNLLKEIKENEQISSDLEEKYQKYNEVIKERNELSNKISQQGFYTSYQEKQKELNQNKDNLSEIINKYPNSYPNETELLSLLEASQKIKQLEEENSYKIDNLETINDRYSLGLPNVDDYIKLFNNLIRIPNSINFSFHLQELTPAEFKCYAAKKNSYTIGSDGRIYKCTEAFDMSENNLGYISKSGEMIIDYYKESCWTSISRTLNIEKCLTCKYSGCCLYSPCPKNSLQSTNKEPVCPRTKGNVVNLIKVLSTECFEKI